MSLINDMLTDLETRKKTETSLNNPIIPTTPTTPPPITPTSISGLVPGEATKNKKMQPRKRVVFLIVILLIVIGIAFWGWPKKQSSMSVTPSAVKISQNTASSPSASSQEITPSIKSPPPAPSIETTSVSPSPLSTGVKETNGNGITGEPALIESFTLSQRDNKDYLQFNLSHPIHYRVDSNPDHQILYLTFEKTQLLNALKIENPNSIVKDIKANRTEDNLIIEISVAPNTEVEELTMIREPTVTLTLVLSNPVLMSSSLVSAIEKMNVTEVSKNQIEEEYQRALALIDQDQLTAAQGHLQRLLQHYPTYLKARKVYATLLLKQKHYTQAQEVLEEGLKKTPDSIELIKLYATLLIEQKKAKEALTVLQRLSPNLQEEPDYYALIAAAEQQTGHAEIAAEIYKQLLNLDDSNGSWWMGLGVTLESMQQINAALDAYQRAITTGDLSPIVNAQLQARINQLGGYK